MEEFIKAMSEFMTEENKKIIKKIKNKKKLTSVELDYLNILMKHKKRDERWEKK